MVHVFKNIKNFLTKLFSFYELVQFDVFILNFLIFWNISNFLRRWFINRLQHLNLNLCIFVFLLFLSLFFYWYINISKTVSDVFFFAYNFVSNLKIMSFNLMMQLLSLDKLYNLLFLNYVLLIYNRIKFNI